MSAPSIHDAALRDKIARLVEERGWNQEDFARNAGLNRLTVRGIFQGPVRRLHNATVAACARALGLGVHDLRELPLERLLARMREPQPEPAKEVPRPANGPLPSQQQGAVDRLYEQATQPELIAWADSNPDRAAQLSSVEWDELFSLQGTGGPLTTQGVHHFVDQIERRRNLLDKVATIAGTEHIDLLEQLVEVLYAKIQPYRDRA